jgi:hypothetical protein
MRLPLLRALAFTLCCAVLASCTLPRISLRKKRPAEARLPRAQNVGTIVLVNEASKFVLIDTGDFPSPAIGTTLTASSGGVESATLLATNVRKRPHLIADIKSGTPRKGDRVVAPPVLKAEPSGPAQRALPVQPTPAPAKKKPFWKFW